MLQKILFFWVKNFKIKPRQMSSSDNALKNIFNVLKTVCELNLSIMLAIELEIAGSDEKLDLKISPINA